jgi:hypothetical protein
VWTDVSDSAPDSVGRREYLELESLMCQAVIGCISEGASDLVEVRRVETSARAELRLAAIDALVDVPDVAGRLTPHELAKLVRASLRGQLWCEFVGSNSRCSVGHDMYVHVRTDTPELAAAQQGLVRSMGLFVQPAEYPFDEGE